MLPAIQRSSHHLSIGEKKRIAIATVLSMNPQILVMDEPSSNLDPRHRRGLIELLNALKMTKVIATHDLDLLGQTCSRLVLMEEGRIVASGDCPDFLTYAAAHS
jgi:cobalt/nickel transport system ATP-binding protein